jgi:hypothetical protein
MASYFGPDFSSFGICYSNAVVCNACRSIALVLHSPSMWSDVCTKRGCIRLKTRLLRGRIARQEYDDHEDPFVIDFVVIDHKWSAYANSTIVLSTLKTMRN